MASAQAFQVFRQSCRAHPSQRPFALRWAVRRTMPIPQRYYSAEATTEPPAEPKQAEGKEQQAEGKPPNPLEENLKAKEKEVVDLMSRLRYLQADFLNLQRNAARDKEQTRDFAITRFASDLLETVDVLSMALKSIPASALSPSEAAADQPSPSTSPASPPDKTALEYLQELHLGVEMTQRQLLQTLFKYQVKPFDPTGDPFDPNRHEAMYQAPIPGKESGTVIDCQKTGYMIKDRVLRAAQVGVAQEAS